MNETIRDDELHAWLDGQLSAARRAEVEAWLCAHPRDAARVEAWRRDGEALRAALAGQMLGDAPALSPRAIRRRLAARRRVRAGSLAAGRASRARRGSSAGSAARKVRSTSPRCVAAFRSKLSMLMTCRKMRRLPASAN